MEQYGFILDVTHLTDQATKEAMELFSGPVLASHHNCRTLVPGQRQLTDEQIRMMVERNAVIGVAFDNWMLYPNWEKGISSRDKVTMDAVANHIDHICQVAGSSVNIGIGSDLDGGFGTEQSPIDLDTIVDIQRLIPLLERRGYKAKEIEGIMFRNWSEFFTRNLPTAESLLETEGK
jgi:membrane dipeptidase